MFNRRGFTLVEMLVVIGIIGILIVALVPVVKGAQTRAKETAVKTQCANIETALANFAQNHGGNYPGVAIDVMAPFADHDLGDPDLYDGSNSLAPATGELVNGVLGGFGHYNSSTLSVFEQIKAVKDTPLGGGPNNTPRFFDSLILSDAIQEYPNNPFVSTSAGERAKMRNVFHFSIFVLNGFTPANNFSPNVNSASAADYACALYVDSTGSGGTIIPDPFDMTRNLLQPDGGNLPLGVPLTNWSPTTFSAACKFGTGDGDYFAPGDFAYVPVLSSSTYPFGDSGATVENEVYRWGATVTGYLLFGYGSKTHKSNEFEDEQREFVDNGLPGYGAPGVDTIYENYVLQCFEGAVYYSKKF